METPKVTGVTETTPAAPQPTFGGVVYETDARGRKIAFKKLKPSQRFQLAEACNFKTPDGEMQGIFVATVVGIDQDGWTPVQSMADLLKRLDTLDDDGMKTVFAVCTKLYGVVVDEKDIAAAKN